MNKARVLISVNGSVPIANNEFFDVSIYSAIDYPLPELTFKVKDEHGHHLAGLDIFPGARIDVIVQDYNDPTDNIQFTNFSVTEIYDGTEFKNTHLGGFVQVWARQSWEFYGDWTSHAYPPMKLSELIKKVCVGANSLAGVKVVESNFKKSSDAGNLPRYKENMNEIDFIKQRCLPYLNVDESCGFFYIDFYGYAHVSSFKEMYSKEEGVLVRQMGQLGNNYEDYADTLEKAKSIKSQYMFSDINVRVGNRNIQDCLADLKQECFFENDQTGKFAQACSVPKLKIKSSINDTIKDRIPINTIKTANIDYLSSKSFGWHNLNDGLSMSNNHELALVDFIGVNVTFDNFPQDIKIGETLYMLTPKYEYGTSSKTHWLMGKWVVAGMNVSVQYDEGTQKVATEVNLISPTLDVNAKTTSIENPKDFYKVV